MSKSNIINNSRQITNKFQPKLGEECTKYTITLIVVSCKIKNEDETFFLINDQKVNKSIY